MNLYNLVYFSLLHFPVISIASDIQVHNHNYNVDDFSWFTENDNIVSPEHLQLPNELSSLKARHQAQMSGKTKQKVTQGSNRRRSHEYFNTVLQKTEGELIEANKILEEARKTGKGSLSKPKSAVQTDQAIRAKQKRDDLVKQGGTQYEEFKKMRRNREKARREARTPEQKEVDKAKKKLRARIRRNWLKLPGNEAEREAKRLKNRASVSPTFAASDSVHDFNLDDFSWFTENDNIVSPEQMYLPNEPSSPKVQHQDQVGGKMKLKQGAKRRDGTEHYSALTEGTEGEANERSKEARMTKPKMFAENDKAVKERLKRKELAGRGGKEYEEFLRERRDKQRARRQALTPEQHELELAKQRDRDQKKRDRLKLPGNEAELEAKKTKSRAYHNQRKEEMKLKQGAEKKHGPENYNAVLERTEGKAKEASERLLEARLTGKGSLIKPKTFLEEGRALKRRLKCNERATRGGKEYEEYLERRRNQQRARRQARTPEQQKLVRAKDRIREQKRRDWLNLPGNEAELEAQRTASLNDAPGSWNSITRSMSKEEIEKLKKMAIPSYPQITDHPTNTANRPVILESAIAGTITATSPITVGSANVRPQEKTKAKTLSQHPATVARRERLARLKEQDPDAYKAIRKAAVARETRRKRNFTPLQKAISRHKSKLYMQERRARLNSPGNEKLKEEAKESSRKASNKYNAKMRQKDKELKDKQHQQQQ
ncbi:uncharacterized protein FA14DRAFT_180019 [Meira miltonrushii]|uniref:ALMS motif domain-containing protein n=1 Tax=Meira miltonrushii TaxID=1280837 RepID=A0A316V8L8_9BASI|nr:uncharacterized protein FA14DRAFT_180019 [Meira miltonrushii]PWN33368.1 hypothetical protein FA14DRAFT_180019 [Meira miltonrushii]